MKLKGNKNGSRPKNENIIEKALPLATSISYISEIVF